LPMRNLLLDAATLDSCASHQAWGRRGGRRGRSSVDGLHLRPHLAPPLWGTLENLQPSAATAQERWGKERRGTGEDMVQGWASRGASRGSLTATPSL
jgi:hypothetical protein